MVVAVMAAGPVLGWAIGRHPWHRSTMVLSIVSSIVVIWTVVLAWRGDAPLWLLVLLVVVIGVGGPASMIGFDLGRTSNPGDRMASATGIINQAGFIASLLLVVAIGLILDWRTPGGGTDYTPSAFRWAMSFQYVLWALGAHPDLALPGEDPRQDHGRGTRGIRAGQPVGPEPGSAQLGSGSRTSIRLVVPSCVERADLLEAAALVEGQRDVIGLVDLERDGQLALDLSYSLEATPSRRCSSETTMRSR